MTDENIKGVEGDEITPSEETPASIEKTPQKEETLSQSDFPEGTEKQRQAFYSMRKKIDELESKLGQQEQDFDLVNLARGTSETPTGYVPASTPGVTFDESDPGTQAFLNEAQTARQEAVSARQAAMQAQAQMEDFEAWQKYPELSPKSPNKNKAFIEDVQKEFLTERLRAVQQGRQPKRLVDLAEQVQKHYEEIRGQAREQALSESQATMEQKEAASLESQGTKVDLTGNTDEQRIEGLRDRVRRGDTNALTELNKLSEPYIQSIPDEAPF